MLMLAVVFSFAFAAVPARKAHAQGILVPIGTSFDFNSIMSHMKEFVLDHMASLLAKQILHQLTVSVVNWINTGFNGSPAFLTNPKGFFLDAADQVTGAFLANEGPLSQLCSPFSIDVRLSLALQQANLVDRRYVCTLGTIINNAQNLPNNISVSGGANITGFVNGDFSQGGWPAFIAMTSEPQNNVYGAYFQAESDLTARINDRQNAITADLTMGNGFLSFQQCKDVSIDKTQEDLANLGLGNTDVFNSAYTSSNRTSVLDAGDGSSIVGTVNKNTGELSYQECHTETPGSVISGVLQKQLNVPADELELANDINSVVNALVTQMLNTMLQSGLYALSGGGSGAGHTSYTAQVIQSINQQTNQGFQSSQTGLSTGLQGAAQSVSDYKAIYDQAVGVVSASRSRYEAARACFVAKLSSLNVLDRSSAQSQVSNIDSALATKVEPLLDALTAKQVDAQTQLDAIQSQIQSGQTAYGAPSSLDSFHNSLGAYEGSVNTTIAATGDISSRSAAAQKDLATAQKQAAAFNADAAQYQSACETSSFSFTR